MGGFWDTAEMVITALGIVFALFVLVAVVLIVTFPWRVIVTRIQFALSLALVGGDLALWCFGFWIQSRIRKLNQVVKDVGSWIVEAVEHAFGVRD